MTTLTLDTATSIPNLLSPELASASRARASAKARPASTATGQTPALRGQELDDQSLLQQMCQGAQWAMEALYQRYYRYAYSLAYHIVHDTAGAEDIVQDAFLAIWRKASTYQKQQGSVRSWLQAIVHHRAIDCVRAAAHRSTQWLPLQTEHEQDLPADTPEVWEEAWSNEQRLLVRRVLAQLSSEQRQVIELAYFEGYTHAQIAERWNIPLGTVKGRMRLGLQKMRQLLHEQGLERGE